MNSRIIPTELHKLIPLAEKWGINNNDERTSLVKQSSNEELRSFIDAMTDKDFDNLDVWLSGDEADHLPYSEEFLAFTCLIMGIRPCKGRVEES